MRTIIAICFFALVCCGNVAESQVPKPPEPAPKPAPKPPQPAPKPKPPEIKGNIQIDGPKEATVGYRVKAKLILDVTDPKIQCFPANDDWYAIQDFSGNKFIDFVPGKKSIPKGQKTQLYTFVVAGHKGSKTYLETYEVTVKADGDPEPEPQPESQLYKDLLAAYKVSPDSASLKQHIKLYTEFYDEVKADKYTSARQAGDALAAKFEKVETLQSVRDVVAEYLQKNVGSSWNKTKLADSLATILTTLKTVPE